MIRSWRLVFLGSALVAAAVAWSAELRRAEMREEGSSRVLSARERREEARNRLRDVLQSPTPDLVIPKAVTSSSITSELRRPPAASAPSTQKMVMPPAGTNPTGFNPAVNYLLPNFAFSPNLRKFITALPGVGAPGCTMSSPPGSGTCHENELGQYIPLADRDTATYPGSDYYEIGLREYRKQMHADLPLPGTLLRGYRQVNTGDSGATEHANQYLGPLILATRDRPVRIKFINELPTGPAGDLFLPVDMTVMGAGMTPNGMEMYTQNRADLHLHGGLTPWISDGTPHQWVTPAGETTTYPKGDAFQNVPDMVGPGKSIPAPAPGDGMGTYYYPNGQSARLMFYHDHSYGITRLNVYAGEAAGYLLTDQVEEDLIAGTNASGANPGLAKVLPDLGGVYHFGIPLVIQDKTFVNDASTPPNQKFSGTPTPKTADTDPLWAWNTGGNLWLPHEYMPNENIYDPLGYNPMGRWDYGPWMIPPMLVRTNILPSPTLIPEAFGDTAVVNGTAFPYLTVPPTAVRFRILNACNDRMLNLQLYYADPQNPTEVKMVPAVPNAQYPTWPRDGREGGVPDPTLAGPDLIQVGNEGGFLVKPAVLKQQPVDFDYNRRSVTFGGVTSKTLLLPPAVRADVIVDFSAVPPGSTLILYNDAPAPMPLYDDRNDYFTDGPDHTAEGGAPPTVAGFGPNTRTIMQIRVDPAGTPTAAYDLATLAQVLPQAYAKDQDPPLVPASAYNAAYGTKYQDIYANSVDESLNVTGTPQPVATVVTAVPGFGYATPPTVVFSGGGGTGATATAALNGITGLVVVTGGTGYTSAPLVGFAGGGGTGALAVATVSGGVVTTITVTNPGSGYTTVPRVTLTGGGGTGATAQATITLGSVGSITLTNRGSGYTSAPQVFLVGGGGTGASAAAILEGGMVLNGKNLMEGFDMEYGRMNAVLGSTPNPLAPTVGAGPVIGAAFYVDPPTEVLTAGQTVLWRISHIGVDSHAIHFHLFNVQVVNRVDWTNTIKPPYEDELGWKETIRTNPFEDIIVAIRPVAMNLPFPLPDSNRLLDPTTPPGSTMNFQPVAPPIGVAGVAAISNVMTNYQWEYVWHCHLLGHEENDMMRPIVFVPGDPVVATTPGSVTFPGQMVGQTSAPSTVTVSNTGLPGTQNMFVSNVAITGTNRGDFALTNACGGPLPPGASCAISVTFTPSATGTRSASMSIRTNDPVTPTLAVPLRGTGVAPPLAPSNLTATITTATAVQLRWRDNSNNETGFTVWAAENGGALVPMGTVPRTGTATTGTGGTVTYTHNGATLGSSYSYYVTAENAAGSSPPSAACILDFAVPLAPSNVTLTAVIVNRNADTVTVAWQDNSNNETRFEIQRARDAAYTVSVSNSSVGANVTTLRQTNLTRNRTNYYHVRAVNLLGASAWVNATPYPLVTP